MSGPLPVVVGSGNALEAVGVVRRRMLGGADVLDALADGIATVEDDPAENTVGFGGLPNADGVVELDAAIMDGRTHEAGAVAAMRGVRHAARVALHVLREPHWSFLAGEGARRFALARGFADEDLLTDASREAWEQWKTEGGDPDAWLRAEHWDWAKELGDEPPAGPPRTFGTVHASAVDASGRCCGCTSTSGLSYKPPGRVGDSPCIGAGLYSSDAGSAGSTGRGESTLMACASFDAVARMERGEDPSDACLAAVERIVRHTTRADLLRPNGRPRFNVTMYAVRADGAFGSAAVYSGHTMAISDDAGERLVQARGVFERPAAKEILDSPSDPG
ncbi:MAG: isoaspartyl peptidase/L-asparaginase [Planctomycetota bacterium]